MKLKNFESRYTHQMITLPNTLRERLIGKALKEHKPISQIIREALYEKLAKEDKGNPKRI